MSTDALAPANPPGTAADPPRPGLVRRLRSHSAPRFLIAGGLSVVIDFGTLRLLHGGLHVNLVVATTAAFTAAMVPNFTLNRYWSFPTGRQGAAHRQALRYVALIVANLVATDVIVSGLAWAGLYYLLAKLVATAVNAVGNFFLYRHWVFTDRR